MKTKITDSHLIILILLLINIIILVKYHNLRKAYTKEWKEKKEYCIKYNNLIKLGYIK